MTTRPPFVFKQRFTHEGGAVMPEGLSEAALYVAGELLLQLGRIQRFSVKANPPMLIYSFPGGISRAETVFTQVEIVGALRHLFLKDALLPAEQRNPRLVIAIDFSRIITTHSGAIAGPMITPAVAEGIRSHRSPLVEWEPAEPGIVRFHVAPYQRLDTGHLKEVVTVLTEAVSTTVHALEPDEPGSVGFLLMSPPPNQL